MNIIDPKTYKTPSDYVKLDVGDNVIRCLELGRIGLFHGMKTSSNYIPMGECMGAECEQCKKGNPAKLEYKWLVYHRGKNEIGILISGKMLGDQIAKLQKKQFLTKDLDPKKYDLLIKRTGVGMQTKYKTELAPVEELTEGEIKTIRSKKDYLLKKYL